MPIEISFTLPTGEKSKAILRQSRVVIGALTSNQIIIRDAAVDPIHAMLEKVGDDHWTLTDLLSSTGCKVNGKSIDVCHDLRPGDYIEIGKVRLDVRLTDSVPSVEFGPAFPAEAPPSRTVPLPPPPPGSPAEKAIIHPSRPAFRLGMALEEFTNAGLDSLKSLLKPEHKPQAPSPKTAFEPGFDPDGDWKPRGIVEAVIHSVASRLAPSKPEVIPEIADPLPPHEFDPVDHEHSVITKLNVAPEQTPDQASLPAPAVQVEVPEERIPLFVDRTTPLGDMLEIVSFWEDTVLEIEHFHPMMPGYTMATIGDPTKAHFMSGGDADIQRMVIATTTATGYVLHILPGMSAWVLSGGNVTQINQPGLYQLGRLDLAQVRWGNLRYFFLYVSLPQLICPKVEEPERFFWVSLIAIFILYLAAVPVLMLSKVPVGQKKTETAWTTVQAEKPRMMVQVPKAPPPPKKKPLPKIPIKPPIERPKQVVAPPKSQLPTIPKNVNPPPSKAQATSPVDPKQVMGPKAAGAPADTAAAKANLSKSLSFLSAGVPSPVSKGLTGGTSVPAGAKYDALSKGAVTTQQGGRPRFTTPGGTGAGDGPIDTKGVNAVKMGKVFKGVGGTGVRGNVDSSAVHGQGGMNAGVARGGMTLSGPGQISQSELEKALAKHIDKLRYCYEKALLYDAGLAGNVVIGWTINPGGSASEVKVQSSQMSNQALHGCLTGVIRTISFPSPKGGPVIVKYPFVFSSSAM